MTRAARARKQLGIPDPVLQFKIWPEDHKPFFYTVKIFKTRWQMRRYLKFLRPRRKVSDIYAFTANLEREIVFCLWTMTDNCIAHEVYHAVAWWATGRRFIRGQCMEWNSPVHERVAEAYGYMVSQIWRRFTEAGFDRVECWGFEDRRTE